MSAATSVHAFFASRTATAVDEQVREESLAVSQGLKRQDAGLLDTLIVRYQHRLLRYLLFLTSNREMAEDLFQEVWMRVLVRGSQFNGKARFDTWLFAIARNLVIDLANAKMLDSSGMGLLIAAANSLAQMGGKVRVTNVSPDIFRLLQSMRLTLRLNVSGREE